MAKIPTMHLTPDDLVNRLRKTLVLAKAGSRVQPESWEVSSLLVPLLERARNESATWAFSRTPLQIELLLGLPYRVIEERGANGVLAQLLVRESPSGFTVLCPVELPPIQKVEDAEGRYPGVKPSLEIRYERDTGFLAEPVWP